MEHFHSMNDILQHEEAFRNEAIRILVQSHLTKPFAMHEQVVYFVTDVALHCISHKVDKLSTNKQQQQDRKNKLRRKSLHLFNNYKDKIRQAWKSM